MRTMWGRLVRRWRRPVETRAERWETPDGDFITIRRLERAARSPADTPHLVLLHGLEGGAHSHYVPNFLAEAQGRGWSADLLLFRGCGGEPNLAPRFYHSGETTDLSYVIARLIDEDPGRPLVLAGVSLGGNVLLKWLGEVGIAAPPQVRAAAAMSVPFDLARGCRHISRGFSRLYERVFVESLREKALAKLSRYPELFDRARLHRARTLWDFDEAVTAPVHGFRDAQDYYERSSSIRYLQDIRVPTYLLSARDDPFLPEAVLTEVESIARSNEYLTVEFVDRGGHVGFVSGTLPWRPHQWGEWRTVAYLEGVVADGTLFHGARRERTA
jgi:uncharacterized protein